MEQPAERELVRMGWRERISFPDWGVRRIVAKLDSGARTSAIHVANVRLLDNGRVRFRVVAHDSPRRMSKWIEADVVRMSRVRPTTGEVQQRIVVHASILLGDFQRVIEVSLVNRPNMLCRVLLGRRAMQGWVVDPSATFLMKCENKQG